MSLRSFIRKETGSFSKWFKIALILLGVCYVSCWLFTIHIAHIQQERHADVILPVMPEDSQEYAALSQSMIHEGSFSQGGVIDAFRVPGYPLFVAFFDLLGSSYFAATLVQIILVFASALILRRIGIRFASRTVGELAAVLLIANPVTLVLSLVILTDILFLFLFISGFYAAVSITSGKMTGKLIAASVFFSAAAYVRPMGFFALPIFIAPLLAAALSLKDKVKAAVIMCLIFAVLISPWIIRNYVKTGIASFSSFKSMNLAYYAVPMFLSRADHISEDQGRAYIEKATGVPQADWRDPRYSKVLDTATEGIILSRPISYASYHIIASLPFLFSSSIDYAITDYDKAMDIPVQSRQGAINSLVSGDWRTFFQSITAGSWKFVERIWWLILYVFAAVALWKYRKRMIVWVFVFVALYLMVLAGPAASVRYALQAWPFIFLLSTAGIEMLVNKIRLGHNQTL